MSEEEKNAGSATDKGDETPASATDKGEKTENMIPKARFDQVLQQRKDAVSALEDIAKEMIEEISEEFRDIVPNLPAAEKIKWIRTAFKKGIFNPPGAKDGPDSKRPAGGQPPADFSKMSPQQMMARGYKTK